MASVSSNNAMAWWFVAEGQAMRHSFGNLTQPLRDPDADLGALVLLRAMR